MSIKIPQYDLIIRYTISVPVLKPNKLYMFGFEYIFDNKKMITLLDNAFNLSVNYSYNLYRMDTNMNTFIDTYTHQKGDNLKPSQYIIKFSGRTFIKKEDQKTCHILLKIRFSYIKDGKNIFFNGDNQKYIYNIFK